MLCHNLWSAVDVLLSMQVHILEDPSEEELGWKLEKLHPDFLVLHGDCPPGKDYLSTIHGFSIICGFVVGLASGLQIESATACQGSEVDIEVKNTATCVELCRSCKVV